MSVRFIPFGTVLAFAIAGSISLGGCANVGDSFASVAFVDPAKYDLYDCERLKAARLSLVKQADDKQALIDKARTGAAGSVVGEVVYRNDYISFRAQKKLADEAWQRNGCDAVTPPALPAAAVPAAAPAPAVASAKSRTVTPSAAPASSAARAIY